MRILWVSHSADLGGAQFALSEAAKALAERGHESHVVLPREGALADLLQTLGAQPHVVVHHPWLSLERDLHRIVRWGAYNARCAVPAVARLARRVRADVVVTNGLTVASGGPAARLARIPHAWFIHEFGTEDHGLSFLLGRRSSFFLMRLMTDLFLVNSDTVGRYFAPALHDRPMRTARYAVEVLPVSTPVRDDGRYHVTLVGEKAPGKGQIDAIDAVALLTRDGVDLTLDLIGGGDPRYESELRQRVRSHQLGDVVRFLSFRADVLSLVSACDVALMCSRCEAFGRVTIEAMKLGKPVVGAASGATPELIREGWNGYLYPPGDVPALAARLRALWADRELREAMGRQGREWATREFSIEAYGATLEESLSGLQRARATRARAT